MENTQNLRDFIKRTRSQRRYLTSISNNLEKALGYHTCKSNLSMSKKFLDIIDSGSVCMKTPRIQHCSSTSTSDKNRPKLPEPFDKSPSKRRMSQINKELPSHLCPPMVNPINSNRRVISLNREEMQTIGKGDGVLHIRKNSSPAVGNQPIYPKQLSFRNKSLLFRIPAKVAND